MGDSRDSRESRASRASRDLGGEGEGAGVDGGYKDADLDGCTGCVGRTSCCGDFWAGGVG